MFLIHLVNDQALLQFDYTFADTPEEQKRQDLLTEQVYVNMSLTKYHQKSMDESL